MTHTEDDAHARIIMTGLGERGRGTTMTNTIIATGN
jgi:hypothetical protein